MRLGAMRVRLLYLAIACLGLSSFMYCADDFGSLLDQAIAAGKQGKYAESAGLLRKAQTLNPDDQRVYEWLNKVYGDLPELVNTGRKELLQLAVRGEQLGTPEGLEVYRVANQILKRSSLVEKRYIRDPDTLKQVVERIFASKDDLTNYVKYLEAAKNKYGRYLVPEYVLRLGHQEPSERIAAFNALVDLGRDAVIPLLVALDLDEAQVRERIAAVLGRIGEPLAISSLRYLVETDPDRGVKTIAEKALERFGNRPESAAPAWRLLVNDGLRMIRGTAGLPRRQYGPHVWRVKDGKLVGEEVATFQVHRRNADVLLRRSAEAAAGAGELLPWAVLTANQAAQVWLYRENLALMKAGGGSEEAVAMLEGQAAEIEGLAQSVRRLGVKFMAGGLKFSLQELTTGGGSPAAVLELIAEIRDQGLGAGKEPAVVSVLADCLQSQSQFVRFEAAVALAALRPSLDTTVAQSVVSNLALAIAEPGARVGLVVSPDEDVRARFGALLDQAGFLAIAVDSVWRGLAEAGAFPPKHVVLFDSNLVELGVPAAIRYLRASTAGAEVPVVVMSTSGNESRDRGLYEKPEEKVQVVPDTVRIDELRTQVLDPIAKQGQDTRQAGEGRAAQAAERLLGLVQAQVSWMPSNLGQVQKSLVTAVGDRNRPDSVRVPACGCVGALGAEKDLSTLTATVKEKEASSAAVRVAGLNAMGEILRRYGLTIRRAGQTAADLEEVLKACLEDEEKEIRVAAARAMGKAEWEPEAFLDVETAFGPLKQ